MRATGILNAAAVCVMLGMAAAYAQDAGVQKRLGVDFPPQKLGDRQVLVGDALVETTSVATWIRPAVSVDAYDAQFLRRQRSGVASVTGRGAKQIAVTKLRIDTAGTFAIVRRIDGVGANDGLRHRYGFYWVVTARWPVIASEPDSVYYYGENAVFSFGAGHMDQRAYAYSVLKDGSVVMSGDGPLVPIEKLWRGKLGGLGEFQIRGTYHGETFLYADSAGRNPRPSVWNVRIDVPPQRELLTLWWDSTEYMERKARGPVQPLDLDGESSFLGPLQFRFAASGPFYEGLYLIPARISAVDVIASPAEFLPIDRARAFRTYAESGGLWQVIELHPSELFLERTPADAPAEVSLRMIITDEFGRITRKTYKSLVYSSRH
jgi:hypothetical protein